MKSSWIGAWSFDLQPLQKYKTFQQCNRDKNKLYEKSPSNYNFAGTGKYYKVKRLEVRAERTKPSVWTKSRFTCKSTKLFNNAMETRMNRRKSPPNWKLTGKKRNFILIRYQRNCQNKQEPPSSRESKRPHLHTERFRSAKVQNFSTKLFNHIASYVGAFYSFFGLKNIIAFLTCHLFTVFLLRRTIYINRDEVKSLACETVNVMDTILAMERQRFIIVYKMWHYVFSVMQPLYKDYFYY